MASNDDEGFDLIQPSLIQQLRKILDEYPDDGQILKELIQNAEDAGATHVKFLHDKNSYGTAKLFDDCEELAENQGPALYAHNNALFTTEDWKGIRLVSDSIKVEDPMKVGRFGLGFKSVFHMTDLPSLLSEYQIGFIDPHGVCFSDKRHRRTGKRWRLREDRDDIESMPDQFSPFIGIFDCTEDVFSKGFYNGTLFRFPLRSTPSALSETLYSAEKVDLLFKSFMADAHFMILFLQHLECIELHVREQKQSKSKTIFQVKIAEECLQTVQAMRKEFLAKIKPGDVMSSSVSVTYAITIETVNFDLPPFLNTKRYSFLVTNYFCRGQVSSTFKKLMTDKALSYLPMVGVAMALPTAPALEVPSIKGHVFCFLPLPVQSISLTGLPVHVNGFFALSQNRCYIKSPNAEQEKAGRHLNDRSLLWNKCLLEEAIPRAYVKMILEAIKGKAANVPETAIYRAWPDVCSINQKWKGVEKSLFQHLLQENVVYTEANRGSWVKVEEAIFQRHTEHHQNDLLMKVLLSNGVSAVAIPENVNFALEKYAPYKEEIDPCLIRQVLRQDPSSHLNLKRKEKLILLKFSLSDGEFSDLEGLQLLPLSNGEFVRFETRAKTVYIASKEHPQELFPGLDERFLDRNVHEDILHDLCDAIDQGYTQLELLTKKHVPGLLWDSLPKDWKMYHPASASVSWFPDEENCNHPPKVWLQLVWRYLAKHFTSTKDIQCLTGLPLIPLNMLQTPVFLTKLCHASTVVVKRFQWDCLDDIVEDVLKKIGIIVIHGCPDFIAQHPLVLGTFVNFPSIPGVLTAMVVCSACSGALLTNVCQLSTPEKQVLRSFLASTPAKYLGCAERELLCSLPLFETHAKRFVSKKDGMFAVSSGSIPIQPLRDLIDVSQEDSANLARLLQVRILNPTELLCDIVFPEIKQGQYTEDRIDKLMPYVLRNFAPVIHTNAEFKRKIRALSFVPKRGKRVKPSHLFDPRNENLQELFAYEDVFPVGEEYNDPSILFILEQLGMKKEDKVTATNIYESAGLVSGLPLDQSVEKKSMAVLQFLIAHPEKLQEPVDGHVLSSLLKDASWVSPLRKKTLNFPPSLPWWKEDEKDARHFFKPTELKSCQFANLIGTVKPTVAIEKSNYICNYFCWGKKPEVFDVVRHLENVVKFYVEDEKPHYMAMMNEIYLFLNSTDYEDLKAVFDVLGISRWAWNGNGFSSPCEMLLDETTIDLTPYIVPLPSEMLNFLGLFCYFGMKTECNPSLLLQVLSMINCKYEDHNSEFKLSEVKHDLKLCVEILNDVANEELSPEVQEMVLFPVQNRDNTHLRLEPVQNCMYCESDDWLTNDSNDEDMDYFYVHPRVPNRTAELLGVPSLANRMLGADELFIGEEFGQEEKLTTRLNRLLDDYTDGFAVPKELIQNADDAGATEVRFLYDERDNEDALTCLIDHGMRGCQGPALWVYNDAIFKEEDFLNITKLNEATKARDTQKIGRFGLGFNAVYNLTDLPMFVSTNYFAIFDPHTSFLGKAIKNARRPGMKINLNKNVKKLRKFKNQFKPFNGIFGCDLSLEHEETSFDGTLFRFPLRTRDQASKSEIKKLCYDDHQIRLLLQMFTQGARNLVLFTQNVLRIGIYHLPQKAGPDLNLSLMFEVIKSKSVAGGILRELQFSEFTVPQSALKLSQDQLSLIKQCSVLQASSEVKTMAQKVHVDPRNFPNSSVVVEINCSFTKRGKKFFKSGINQEKTTWLVVSSMGSGGAMKVAKNNPTLLPSAGVAALLQPKESCTFCPLPIVKKVDGLSLNATIFCYLPLPIHSGLFFHVNGAFAVTSNRRSLQEKVEDDKTCFGVKWNNVLMQDSVVSAFLDLLADLKAIAPRDGSYAFHSLWPRSSQVQRNCRSFLKSFYSKLAGGGYSLFSDGKKWVDINHTVFLHPEFREESKIGEAANKVLQVHFKGHWAVIDMPGDILHSFQACDLMKDINTKSFSKFRFYSEVFFPNIATISANLRDLLILHALDCNRRDFNQMVMEHACIPVSPNGHYLKRPSDLVHPDGEAASLFLPEDGRFPYGSQESYLHPRRLLVLENLKMASNHLCWNEIAERAESIHVLNAVNSDAAGKRLKALISFMERKIAIHSSPGSDICLRFARARFLPVLKKPVNFPLHWKGDEFEENSLLSPSDMCTEEKKYLVCCTEPLIGNIFPNNVQELFKPYSRTVTVDHVMEQLENAMSVRPESLSLAEYEELDHVCRNAYEMLQHCLFVHGAGVIGPLQEKRFILVERRFLSAKQISFTLTADCSPYLFKLPIQLAESFAPLMKAAGVRKKFDVEDYISALHEVQKEFKGNVLDEQTLRVAIHLANQLGETVQSSRFDLQGKRGSWETVPLPDSKGVMRVLSDLCVRDSAWIPDEEGVHFVHDRIPWPTCVKVRVKTRRREALRRHAIGIPFGQKEKLTNRLKRILTGYPCEKDILKELLQNADDAQATEICFIKDPRHHSDKKVFEDSWKPLQGPALCVYNNRPFTDADIQGIGNLGEGSKGDDPNKTGQYGVGFNAVYHLTDVPSFMTRGKEIGDVLCAFDPHCTYVPDATPEEPGVKIEDISRLKILFPDVFSCYLEDHFPLNDSTMFRFPLRTREMSKVSHLSRSPVTLTMLDAMMKDLKNELFEILLFVNNVKKITMCEVNEQSGKLANVYSVEVTMSEEDEAKRKAFANYIKQIGELIKRRKDLILKEIPVGTVSYVLNIADNTGNREKWLIVQQIGFEKEVPERVNSAFKRRDLGMLPIGGAAFLLERNSFDPMRRPKKAYCFLPLPIETDLPVHINGHFALDHEARRNLWGNEFSDYRSDWNKALLADVVASCYLLLVVEVRSFLQLPVVTETNRFVEECSETEMMSRIRAYERIFPLAEFKDPYWKALVDSLFQKVNTEKLQVLPVVRKKPTNATSSILKKNTPSVEITWLPCTGQGNNQAFFNNLMETGPFAILPERQSDENQIKSRKMFEEILLASGFNLVASSMALYQSLRRSEVSPCTISPFSVIEFYKSINSPSPLCKIGTIPCPVKDTPFRSYLGIICVLLYCKQSNEFVNQLSGLPLLLTQDNYLQLFSSTQPKFLSRFRDLLPGSPQVFLHEQVYDQIFQDLSEMKLSVLKPLDIEGFVANLSQTLPLKCYGKATCAEWSPYQNAIPNNKWISRVWVFLRERTKDIFDDLKMNAESKILKVKRSLESLDNWCVIPAFQSQTAQKPAIQFLVPLCRALSILDCSSPDSSNEKLVEVLRKLGVPELNHISLTRSSLSSSSLQVSLARVMVSSLKDPTSLLTCLDMKIAEDPQSSERLEPEDCTVILEYFSTCVRWLKNTDQRKLKKLPLYLATHGGYIRLEQHHDVKVLPTGIPKQELEVLEREVGVVFLESFSSLSKLFEFLGVGSLSVVDVYCTFILPNLNLFSQEARQIHLKYVRQGVMSTGSLSDDDKGRLLDSLKMTSFIPSTDGSLRKACFFYDPHEDVFRTMLLPSDFPPEPFESEEWLKVLKKIGLVHEVSQDLFRRFATDVAQEAKKERTEKTDEKSRVLVKHLMRRTNVVEEGLLPAIRDIPFVVCEPVRKGLRDLCPPFKALKKGQNSYCAFKGAVPSDYAEIVWTRAHLLPVWAIPKQHTRFLGCPEGTRRDHYCDQFIMQLQIMKNPTTELVVSHCETICSHLERQSEGRKCSSEESATRTAVMIRIYEFLQTQANRIPDNVKTQLSSTPFIVVEEGTKFVLPSQVVLEFYEHFQIKPYLYSVPRELGKYHPLFQVLGCRKHVTVRHYAMVLEMLHKSSMNKKLHPNEVIKCVKASRGLFEELDKNEAEVKDLSKLHLPAVIPGDLKDNRVDTLPLTLQESPLLIFNDRLPSFFTRLEKLDQYFLLDLDVMKVKCSSPMTNYKDLIMKLPSAIRPKMLSCVVHEKLIDSQSEVTTSFEAVDSIKRKLSSPEFCSGVIRLIRDVNCQNQNFDEKVIGEVERGLPNIDICLTSNLRTTLFYEDAPIPFSEANVRYFLQKTPTPGGETRTVYVDVMNQNTLVPLVSHVIGELFGEYLGKRSALISQMLSCEPSEICLLLDTLQVRADNSNHAPKVKIFPRLGTFIPLEDHHLLNEDFEDFETEEYIGYELEDPTLHQESGVATYIYARIVEEVTDRNCSHLAKKYRIDIGDNQEIDVDATDLYKFHRSEEDLECKAIVVADGQSRNASRHGVYRPKNKDKQEVFSEISRLLEEAWKMSEEKRRKVIKRLYLRWHPDKNVGEEEFCSVLFKHLMNEISRLESGQPGKSQENSFADTGRSQQTSYQEFFSSWGDRARQHHAQREGYRTRPPAYGGFYSRPNPQPGEAKRWFRQAQADLAAVSNDVVCHRPFYEWACFKCHQAAEKALKATLLTIDADSFYDHGLAGLCGRLNDEELSQLAIQLECIVGNYARMRYPDKLCFPRIPNDVYDEEMAQSALQLATRIVDRVRGRIP
ncbi:sacsin-like [Montipora capricornis]|uniref:sacsin-like n=1 Tax=Montipora capricornis TaxID=246305 RepID=UPI0035F1CD05